LDDRTKLVQVSQVNYVNGYRFDLKSLADIVHKHGAKLLADATQAVGALIIDVKREEVDYLAAAPYKFLMGPAGLAFLYVKEEFVSELSPHRVGWKNQLWKGKYAEKPLKQQETAEKIEYGTLYFEGIYGLERSFEYINKIGMNTIERRNLRLSDYLWNHLNNIGMKMFTPPETKSTIVSFYEGNAMELASKLMVQKVKVSGRNTFGGHIRVSPHFYNTEANIDHFINRLIRLKKKL
jgi:selenocysteine lyase/cysteine desulfurase